MLQTVINNKHILAGWMDDGNIFYYSWKGFVPSAEMKQLLEEVLSNLEIGKSTLMLQDLQHTQAVTTDMQEWFATSWLPRAAAGGLRKIALLTPKSVFGQMAVNQVKKKFSINNIDIESMLFDDEVKAVQWLRHGSEA